MKNENNLVSILGTVSSEFKFSHSMVNEDFYLVHMSITRQSGQSDDVPVLVSHKLINTSKDMTGLKVSVEGSIRTKNVDTEGKRKLLVYVFADEISPVDIKSEDVNNIYLYGYVCKQPIYRKTPLGREITDLSLAVNRPFYKTDYIPVIAWGRNASYISNLAIGDSLEISGRFQSREYSKKLSEDEVETRITYEVSAHLVNAGNEKSKL